MKQILKSSACLFLWLSICFFLILTKSIKKIIPFIKIIFEVMRLNPRKVISAAVIIAWLCCFMIPLSWQGPPTSKTDTIWALMLIPGNLIVAIISFLILTEEV